MYLLGQTTRHTKVGTFRFGVVYNVDESDYAIRKHVLPLTEGEDPVLKKISEKQAAAAKSTPLQFTPEIRDPGEDAPAASKRSAVAQAKAAQKEAETAAADAMDRASKAEDGLKEAADVVTAAEQRAADAEDAQKAAETAAAASLERATVAESRVAELSKELEDLKAATLAPSGEGDK